MIKKFLSLVLLILVLPLALFGCENEQEVIDPLVIKDNTYTIGVLLPENESSSKNFEQGFLFASGLADSVNINNEEIFSKYTITKYTSDSITANAQKLVNDGVSAIVFYGEDLKAFDVFTNYIKDTNVPVLSLSPYTCDYNRFYSLSLSPEYKASCSATYALDKGYSNGAVLCETDEEYFHNFAEIFKNTFKAYIGTEPTIYYKNGESANYTDSVLVSGNYDYLLLICPSEERLDTVNNLRNKGFMGEIMFDEVFDHTTQDFNTLINCSFMTKLEEDTSNNISTVFTSQFTEYAGINSSSVTSAAAYGYDAYMAIFEAFKSFSKKDTTTLFKNETEPSSAVTDDNEITLSDFSKAIEDVVYYGVTDKIQFKNNTTVPTYIYVDNITDSEITLCKKYTFSEQ